MAFCRFSRATACAASLVLARDWTSSSICASLRRDSSRVSSFLRASTSASSSLVVDVEFGLAHVESRLQEVDLVLGRLDRPVRVQLLQFERRFFDLALAGLERELLLGGVESHDDLAGRHARASRRQLHETEVAADGGSGNQLRASGDEFAGRVDVGADVAALDRVVVGICSRPEAAPHPAGPPRR